MYNNIETNNYEINYYENFNYGCNYYCNASHDYI